MVTDEDKSSLRNKELDELHAYSRTNFQLYVTWFTFFVTVNYLVLGGSSVRKDGENYLVPFSYICWMFIVLNIFATLAGGLVIAYTDKVNSRIEAIMKEDEEQWQNRVSPFPTFLYRYAPLLMTLSCLVLLWLWVAVLRLPR